MTAGARVAPTPAPLAGMVLVGVAVFAVTGLAFFRVPLLPSIGDDLSLSTTHLGLLTATYAVGRLAMDVPAGLLADRLPVAAIMRTAAVLVAAGSAVLAASQVAAAAFVAVFVLGSGSALANTSGAAYFSGGAAVARRGLAVSAFAAAQLGGQAIGPAASGFLAAVGSWRLSEAVAVAVALGLFVVFALGPRFPARASAGGHGGAGARADGIPVAVRWVLYSVPFVLFLTIGAIVQTLAPVIGDERLGLSPSAIGAAIGLGGVCRFVGAVVAGQVADRVARKAAIVPGLALQTVGVTLLATADADPALWLTAIVLLSLGSVGTTITMAVLADLAPPGTLGALLGRFRFVGDIGLIVGPAATARLYDAFGPAAAVLPVAGLGAACAVAVAVVVPETRWQHEPRGQR